MMKSIMKRAASTVLATALVVTGIYCGGTEADAAVKVKKITMNTKSVNLTVGKKFTLKVKKVTPKKASKKVTYKTSSKKVATVSSKGVITAKKKGTAKITVTSKSNKKVKATVKVTVRNAAPATPSPATQAPVATATATAKVTQAPATDAPTATPTNKPKATKKPAATPSPTPAPRYPKPESTAPASVKFDFKELDIEGGNTKTGGFVNESPEEKDEEGNVTKKGASYKILDDGSMEITMTGQWAAVNFFLPDTAEMCWSNYKCAVVTYKLSGTSADAADDGGSKIDLGYAVWDELCDPTSNDRNTLGKHPNWGQNLVKSDDYNTVIVSKEGVADADTYFGEGIRAFQIFNPHAMGDNDSIVITVKSIYLYDEMKEEGFVPGETEPATPQALEVLPSFDSAAKTVKDEATAVKVVSDQAITIDGVVDELWDAADFVKFGYYENHTGESTSEAQGKFVWDDQKLYVLAVVKDSEITAESGNHWECDGLDVYFDEDNSRTGNYSENTDAFQYRYTGFAQDSKGNWKKAKNDSAQVGTTDYKVEAAYKVYEGGYVVELAVTFKKAVKANQVLGFESAVVDCSGDKRNGEIYLTGSGKKDAWTNTALLGTIKLVEAK